MKRLATVNQDSNMEYALIGLELLMLQRRTANTWMGWRRASSGWPSARRCRTQGGKEAGITFTRRILLMLRFRHLRVPESLTRAVWMQPQRCRLSPVSGSPVNRQQHSRTEVCPECSRGAGLRNQSQPRSDGFSRSSWHLYAADNQWHLYTEKNFC